jgi:hypothetical protein
MTAIRYAAPGSEFDEFLYAAIAEEHNGTLLSVLSALARSNLDPWEEAARLAALPRAAARQFLASMIAAIPEGPVPRGDPGLLVERLIALLPRPSGPASQPPPAEPARPRNTSRAQTITWALYVAAILFMVISQWMLGHRAPHATTPRPAATVTPAVDAHP